VTGALPEWKHWGTNLFGRIQEDFKFRQAKERERELKDLGITSVNISSSKPTKWMRLPRKDPSAKRKKRDFISDQKKRLDVDYAG
jgi:hypothetical protein